jgi:peptidoglycan hydrolase-like protein with peptidoglycan-binding domain
LRRQADDQPEPSLLRRQPEAGSIQEHLQSPRFVSSAKLERCFENKDRLGENDPDADAVTRIQQALLDLAGITGQKYDLGPTGADGRYGPKTAAAVRKFKTDEKLGSTQFGDVGPGTMHRLDELFAGSQPPSPRPQPRVPVLTLKPDSGPVAGSAPEGPATNHYTIHVVGDDFTQRSAVIISFDDHEEFHAVPDDNGHFERTITPARRATGKFSVRAFDAFEEATATFTVPTPVDPTDPSRLNPELEALLDRILLQYEQLLLEKLSGLVDLERDLRGDAEKETTFEGILISSLKFLAERSIELVLNAELTRVLKVIEDQLGVSEPPAGKPGVKDVFDELQNISLDVLKNAMGVSDLPIGNPRQFALEKFIDGQRQGLTAASLRFQESFVLRSKPRMRELLSAPKSAGDDPRVAYATAVLNGVAAATTTARRVQYDESAIKWATFEAQQTVGTRTSEETGDVTTDLSKEHIGMGVFIIEVSAGAPTNLEPAVNNVRVEGLTEKTRKHLEQSDRPLAQLGPRRIVAVTTNPSATVKVSKNEEGEVFVNNTDAEALRWLSFHAAATDPGIDTPKGGALALWDQIETGPRNTLKKAGGLKL